MPITVPTIFGSQSVAALAEETLLLSLDGATAAATVPVAAGTKLTITDVLFGEPVVARVQQADDGVTFYDIAILRRAFNGSNPDRPNPDNALFPIGLLVDGDAGSNVVIRALVTNEQAFPVTIFLTIQSYLGS